MHAGNWIHVSQMDTANLWLFTVHFSVDLFNTTSSAGINYPVLKAK